MKLNLRVLLAKDEMVIVGVHHWCVRVERLRVAVLEKVAVQFVRVSQDFCRDNRSMTTQSLLSRTLLSKGQCNNTVAPSYCAVGKKYCLSHHLFYSTANNLQLYINY
jgi:hypothetical protein